LATLGGIGSIITFRNISSGVLPEVGPEERSHPAINRHINIATGFRRLGFISPIGDRAGWLPDMITREMKLRDMPTHR
jgi:hypothetical protein